MIALADEVSIICTVFTAFISIVAASDEGAPKLVRTYVVLIFQGISELFNSNYEVMQCCKLFVIQSFTSFGSVTHDTFS